jgi:hypothetical protein
MRLMSTWPEPALIDALGRVTLNLLLLEEEATLIVIAVREMTPSNARALIRQGWKDHKEVSLLRERQAGTGLLGHVEASRDDVRAAQTNYASATVTVAELTVVRLNGITSEIEVALPSVHATRIAAERFEEPEEPS